MDAVKKPESLVAGSALVVTLASAAYLNKQQNKIKEDVAEITEHLTTTISELRSEQDVTSKHDKHIIMLSEGIKQLNILKSEHNETFEYISQILSDRDKIIEGLVESVSEIQNILTEKEGELTTDNVLNLIDSPSHPFQGNGIHSNRKRQVMQSRRVNEQRHNFEDERIKNSYNHRAEENNHRAEENNVPDRSHHHHRQNNSNGDNRSFSHNENPRENVRTVERPERSQVFGISNVRESNNSSNGNISDPDEDDIEAQMRMAREKRR